MTTDQTLPANRPPTPPALQSQSSTPRATSARLVELVASCLALVRPAGMTDEAATEFLAVAAAEVAEYPLDILDGACRTVRRSAHAPHEIVPALVELCESALLVRRFRERRRAEPPRPAPRPPAPPLTQRDVDRLPPYLKRIGLACGALVEDTRGRVRPAPAPGARRRGRA